MLNHRNLPLLQYVDLKERKQSKSSELVNSDILLTLTQFKRPSMTSPNKSFYSTNSKSRDLQIRPSSAHSTSPKYKTIH